MLGWQCSLSNTMQTVNTAWNMGSFSLALSVNVDADTIAKLADCGLRYLGQRVTEVDKILGAFTTDRSLAKNPKGKGPWRKKEWSRGAVGYTPELANKLKEAFTTLSFPKAEGEEEETPLPGVSVVIGQYEKEVPKYEAEREVLSRHESAKGDATAPAAEQELSVWLKGIIKYDGPTHTEDGEDYAIGALAAVKAYVDEIKRKATQAI